MNTTSLQYVIEEYTPEVSHHPEIKAVRVDFHHGIAVELLNYGAIIRSIEVPDKQGNRANVVLSYPTLSEYVQDTAFVGCQVGRYANRIANGKLPIENKWYQLACNQGGNHLHGGGSGFNKALWDIIGIQQYEDHVSISLSYLSKDGEEGYPGNLMVYVEYEISRNSLNVSYRATTDHLTVYNPTAHHYFNLTGDFNTLINDHVLKVASSGVLEKNGDIPTGRILPVKGTTYDFNIEKKINNNVYDDCFVLDGKAVLKESESGRMLTMKTTLPGLQLYTSDFLDEVGFTNRSGVCLEAQFYPDSPNHAHFPTTLLRPGQDFFHQVVYVFHLCEL